LSRFPQKSVRFIIEGMKSAATQIVRTLRRNGYEALLVGGCVRDLLLGLRPKDWDIATNARPEEIMRLFQKTVPVGAQFGVVIVRKRGKNFEVATFRRDLGYDDGRHPAAVQFSDAAHDARRRDFTINGMFFDPLKSKVLDFVGGRRDLKAGLIRAIGNPGARIQEDKLRMLRAARFSARFNYPIEPKTRSAIQKYAGQILEVSRERIREEMVMIFTQKNPDRGLELLDELGLLKVILPEVARMKAVPQPPQFHPEGDVFTHTRLMLKMMKNPSPELAFAVLLHDIGKPPTFRIAERIRFDGHTIAGAEIARRILRRLRFSNRQIQAITALVKEHLRFIDAPRMKESTLKRFVRLENFDWHLELHRLDCLASHADLSTYRYVKKRLEQFRAEEKSHQARPRRLVTGDDLIELGLTPGPIFRTILDKVEDAQLDGKIQTREEALELAKKLAGMR